MNGYAGNWQGTDGAGFDPGAGIAFSSNGEGTLTLVKEVAGKYEAVETVTTKTGSAHYGRRSEDPPRLFADSSVRPHAGFDRVAEEG
ncbi:MAG: hypothetical protein HY238_00310 [Acidobacteria bacterium]|nr:hypothetical protein [Acidobacteriota bacterium]